MNRTRVLMVLIILAALVIALAGAFMTRGVMAYLPFLHAKKGEGGKKEERSDKATKAAGGRFAAAPPPLRIVNNR